MKKLLLLAILSAYFNVACTSEAKEAQKIDEYTQAKSELCNKSLLLVDMTHELKASGISRETMPNIILNYSIRHDLVDDNNMLGMTKLFLIATNASFDNPTLASSKRDFIKNCMFAEL